MKIGNILSFLKKINQEASLRQKFSQARTDEEIEKIAIEAGFFFPIKDFYSVIEEMPENVGELNEKLRHCVIESVSDNRLPFCEECGSKGGSFCINQCYWGKI